MQQGRVLCLLAFVLFLSVGFVHAKYFTATELLPESSKTNVVFGSENIYFDLYEGGSPLQSAELLVQYSSNNGTNPNTFYVFIRRWSPLVGATSEKDIESLIEECELAASMPLSYNQYECYYALVEPDVVVSPANLTLNFPRFGRYFVLIQNTFPNGTEYIMASNVTIGLQYHNCPNPAHVGQGCTSSVQTFTNPLEATVAADTWEYFLHSVDPGVPAINIDFLSSLDHITSPNASVAFRIGNTPIYGDYDVGFYNFKQNDSYKWINPLTGNLYIGIYGGDSGVTTSFNVSTEVCALPTNGAYCEAPLLQNVLCVAGSVDECPFVDNKVVIGSNYELKIDSQEWEYVHFQLGASGFAVNLITRLKEYTDDSALTIVVNVGGIPNNNDENGFETFSLKDVFPFIRGLRSDDLESDIEIPYPTRMAGYYYVGFHNSGKDDLKVDFVVEYTNCPSNCSGNGVCNLQTFTCACDTNEFNPIDCSSPQTPSTATSSSKTPSTATPTTADSKGSDVRSTIHDTISNLSSDEGHGGDTASAVVITISILFPLIVLFSMLVAITVLFFLRKRTDYERVE